MMTGNKRETIVLKNVGLMFRNFSGEARQYNNAGDRNFNARISQAQAEMLKSKGFRIKVREPNQYNDEPIYLLKVKVSYRFDEPNINVINSRCRRKIGEESVSELDHISVETCDISIVGSNWVQASGESGVTAYLRSMYLTIKEDPLDLEYAEYADADMEEVPF